MSAAILKALCSGYSWFIVFLFLFLLFLQAAYKYGNKNKEEDCMCYRNSKNCFLYVKFGLNGFILRVGTPRYVYFLIALDFLEGIVLSYRQIAFDGTVMRTGALNEAGRGLYYLEIHDGINDSFIEIVYSNTIRPYSSVSSKLVKYELVYADHYMRLKNTPLIYR